MITLADARKAAIKWQGFAAVSHTIAERYMADGNQPNARLWQKVARQDADMAIGWLDLVMILELNQWPA